VEVLVVTIWFYVLVVIAGVFASLLVLKVMQSDNRDVARFEPPAEDLTIVEPIADQPLAA